MARALVSARPMGGMPDPEPEGVLPEWRQVAFPPKGMDNYTRPLALDLSMVSEVRNAVPWSDGWRQRSATELVGNISSVALLYAYRHQTANGESRTYRWTLTGVEELTGTSWTALTGPTMTSNTYSGIALTQWGDLLIFSNGLDGMFVLTPSTRTYATIANAPSAVHLTTFNRRVVASVPNSGRVQWCVAGDYTNWTATDLGAGYEDLLASPGGAQDTQSAVIPVSDDVAHVWRGTSIWQMSPTRQVAAPFAFSRLVSGIGSRWPKTCVAIPGGSAAMSDDRIWTMTGEGPKDISIPVKGTFTGIGQSHLRKASMAYSNTSRSLMFCLPGRDGTVSLDVVYVFSFETSAWCLWEFVHTIRAVCAAQYRDTATIGELSGTIGSLSGVIGDLGVSDYASGFFIISGDAHPSFPNTYFVEREAPDLNGSTLNGVSVAGANTSNAVAISWRTGVVSASDPSRWVHLHEMEITYTHTGGAPAYLTLEYEADYSGSWTPILFQSQILTGGGVSEVNSKDRTLRIPLNLQVEHPRLRMEVLASANFRLLDWRIRVTDGARRSMHA